jgi:predicted NAD/FAD-binding protein
MNLVPSFRTGDSSRQKIAVVGSGISGASAAWALHPFHDVTLFEAADRPGGHTATVDVQYRDKEISVDTGFIVYNELNYPLLTALFNHLDVSTHPSDMGFSLSLDDGKLEWCGSSYRSIFARKRNAVSLPFLWMLREIIRFNGCCVVDRNRGETAGLTIGDYLDRKRFSKSFRDNYLIPMAAAIWSTPRAKMLDFPADTFITFFENHRLIHHERPQWRTVTGGSREYLKKLLLPLGTRVRTSTPVRSVLRDTFGVTVVTDKSEPERFDQVILAGHSDQSLEMLGDATASERNILSTVPFCANRVVLHCDERLMPRRKAAWSAWNYLRSTSNGGEAAVSVTYWMNRLQGIDERYPLFVSLNPSAEPREETVFGEWTFDHPLFDANALAAQSRLFMIQGMRRTWYSGAWTGHGFHEDGLRSGLNVALALGVSLPWAQDAGTPDVQVPIAAE